ncbi:hypothetical protein FB45DRAFT_948196 [Roridomyces roridus]|uniref:Steroid 5-alpha reductase C-terminal domain-containing protein n=1 Tax=Roridomyces roridus TaxID=1738132 RepID=A0AAD7F7Q3_9AGAR|nr:hypothetical protein FB45DRAFT_948196 [Roridomyces roridus]
MSLNSKPRASGLLADLRDKPPTSSAGTAVFALGRIADAPLQYLMFSEGWAVKALTSVGLRASNILVRAGPGVGGLGPIPTLLVGMYSVASLRHAYYALCTKTYNYPPSTSLSVVTFSSATNTVTTLLAVHALTSSPYPILGSFTDCIGWKQWVGVGLFSVGIVMELVAEEGRKAFKKNPKNVGKVYDQGLWSLVRHPNYLGFNLWRAGIALATGSLAATAILSALQLSVFYTTSIPELSDWMARKYGSQWTEYTQRVQYALIPGLW